MYRRGRRYGAGLGDGDVDSAAERDAISHARLGDVRSGGGFVVEFHGCRFVHSIRRLERHLVCQRHAEHGSFELGRNLFAELHGSRWTLLARECNSLHPSGAPRELDGLAGGCCGRQQRDFNVDGEQCH
jgi:hypothetical protein